MSHFFPVHRNVVLSGTKKLITHDQLNSLCKFYPGRLKKKTPQNEVYNLLLQNQQMVNQRKYPGISFDLLVRRIYNFYKVTHAHTCIVHGYN